MTFDVVVINLTLFSDENFNTTQISYLKFDADFPGRQTQKRITLFINKANHAKTKYNFLHIYSISLFIQGHAERSISI